MFGDPQASDAVGNGSKVRGECENAGVCGDPEHTNGVMKIRRLRDAWFASIMAAMSESSLFASGENAIAMQLVTKGNVDVPSIPLFCFCDHSVVDDGG